MEGATPMLFEVGVSLPDFDDLPETVREDALWRELATAHGEDEDAGSTYAEYVRGGLSPPAQLVQGNETGGWGDAGIAHLFGDPSALARGDVSLVRYHWDCS